MIRTYSELIKLNSFEERFEYLKIDGNVGIETFGFDRFLAQQFYTSTLWRQVRSRVIARDQGFDLGVKDVPIKKEIIVHHMNPVMLSQIMEHDNSILLEEYLICVSSDVHRAIHYGSKKMIEDIINRSRFVERCKNDTCPWKR